MTPQKEYNAEKTRSEILQAAFEVVWEKGFNATSIKDVLDRTQLTKGALYYHFKNKQELGLLLIEEVLGRYIRETWEEKLSVAEDPIDGLLTILKCKAEEGTEKVMECGCPLNNLTQELSGQDESYRKALKGVYDHWHACIRSALERGRARGTVRPDVDPDAVAWWLISSIEGLAGLMKNLRSREVGQQCMQQIFTTLNTLRT